MAYFVKVGEECVNLDAVAKAHVTGEGDAQRVDVWYVGNEHATDLFEGESAKKFIGAMEDHNMREKEKARGGGLVMGP